MTTFMKTPYQKIAHAYVYPVVGVLTMITNLMMIAIFVKQKIYNIVYVLIIAIAITDIMAGSCPSLLFFYYLTLENYNEFMPYTTCVISKAMIVVLPATCHGISIWLTIVLGVERSIVVKYPFFARKINNNVKYPVAIILFVYLSIPCVLGATYPWNSLQKITLVSKKDSYTSIETSVDVEIIHDNHTGVCYIVRMLVMQIIPCFVLVLTTILLTTTVRKFERQRQKISTNISSSLSHLHGIVIAVMCVYLTAEIPNTIVLLIRVLIYFGLVILHNDSFEVF